MHPPFSHDAFCCNDTQLSGAVWLHGGRIQMRGHQLKAGWYLGGSLDGKDDRVQGRERFVLSYNT